MPRLKDRLKKTLSDFRETYGGRDAAKKDYTPLFYEDLLTRADAQGGISQEAFGLMTSYKAVHTYMSNINWMHKVLAQTYGDDSLQKDPRFLSMQFQESRTWLLIHVMDDMAESLAQKGHPEAIKQVIQYVEGLLFDNGAAKTIPGASPGQTEVLNILASQLREDLDKGGYKAKFKPYWDGLMEPFSKEGVADSMEEYRKLRREVGIQSTRLCTFFITGAGDEQYAQTHYGKNLPNLLYSSRKIGEVVTLIDSYIDFEGDKGEVMQNFKTRLGDRSWFLYAGMREGLEFIAKEHIRHAGHLSGASAYFAQRATRHAVEPLLEKLSLSGGVAHPEHDVFVNNLLTSLVQHPFLQR